jgi:outer membrane protein assembly factor BamD
MDRPSQHSHFGTPPIFRPSRLPLAALVLLLALAAACTGGRREDPILQLSATESLAQGKELMSQEKYLRARPYLVHAFEVEPNSATGREGLLLAADTFFLEDNRASFIQAEGKYRDFLNRFPTSERAPYAQFQRANSLARQMDRPDRDQTTTRKALEAYQELMQLYPTSEYAAQARDQIQLVRANLAEHEYMVARFYNRFRLPQAAAGRLEGMLEEFPEYTEKDKVLFQLGKSYASMRQIDKASSTFDRLRRQFPDSPYLEDIPKLPAAPAPAPAEVPAAPSPAEDAKSSPPGGGAR